jgi:hypothetical protein
VKSGSTHVALLSLCSEGHWGRSSAEGAAVHVEDRDGDGGMTGIGANKRTQSNPRREW